VVVDRPLDEAELVERARRGDLEAWETLVRTYQGIAFRTAYVLAGNAADAEEAAQDGFVKAQRALGRFRRGAPLRPWLLRIVANEARNRRRSAGRRERLVLLAAAESRPGGAVPSPEAALVAREDQERLLAAVERLPDGHRDAIACRYFDPAPITVPADPATLSTAVMITTDLAVPYQDALTSATNPTAWNVLTNEPVTVSGLPATRIQATATAGSPGFAIGVTRYGYLIDLGTGSSWIETKGTVGDPTYVTNQSAVDLIASQSTITPPAP
jgi:RNA polymerase sigma-70 factor (ECF subfamily)